MPLRLFHSRNVSGANVVMALLVVGMFGIFFLGALYMQLVLGYEPLEVGLAFLPGSLLMGVLSLGFTDKLNMRFGPRRVLIAGLSLLLVAMLLFARTPVDGNYLTDLFPTMLLFGGGAGVAFPALMMLAMSGATPQDAGLASGLVNTTGQVGGAIGLALLATISTERTQALLDDGESTAAALTGGFHVAYLIGAAATVAAIVAAVTVLRQESPAAAMAGAHDHGEREVADAPTGPAYDTAQV
jgi:MFS family permease